MIVPELYCRFQRIQHNGWARVSSAPADMDKHKQKRTTRTQDIWVEVYARLRRKGCPLSQAMRRGPHRRLASVRLTVPLPVLSSNVSATRRPSSFSRVVNVLGCPVIDLGWNPTTISDVTLRVGPYGSKRRLVMLFVFDATRIR